MGAIIFDTLGDVVINRVDMVLSRTTSADKGRKGERHDDKR